MVRFGVRLLLLATLAGLALPRSAYAGPGLDVYEVSVPPTSFAYSPGAGATVRSHLVLWSRGSATTFVSTTSVTRRLAFTASAQHCEGAPRLEVAVDGVTLMSREIQGLGNYGVVGTWAPGRHQVTFRFLNDRVTAACDRNVVVDYPTLLAYASGSVLPVDTIQVLDVAQATVAPTTAGRTEDGKVWVDSDATVSFLLDSQGARSLSLSLDGAQCAGRRVTVVASLDGVPFHAGELPAPYWEGIESHLRADGQVPNGTHEVTLAFSNLTSGACTRTVSLNRALFRGLV